MQGFLIAWASFSSGLFALTLIFFPEWSYYRNVELIRESEMSTKGFEIGVNCDSGSRGYVYVVGDETYIWRKSLGLGPSKIRRPFRPSSEAVSDCHDRIGAPLIVYYEQINPANSIGEYPTRIILEDFLFFAFVIFQCPYFF